MQSYALTIDKFLDHAAKWHGNREVISARSDGAMARIGYKDLKARAQRLSGALHALELSAGDCLATLGWNTQHHLEVYYASMGVGMVCHTLNPRLTAAHLAGMINEAEDRVVFAASNLGKLVSSLLPLCPEVEHVVWMDGDVPSQVCSKNHPVQFWSYESFLEACGQLVEWGRFDEETPAGLCYTSGTTGPPKGVLYTHRSNYLHTLRSLQADALAITSQDSVLVAVPMFHANGWGLPFAVPAVGAKLVLPGRQADGDSLTRLMRQEGVSLAAGVQTVWLGVLDHLDETGGDLPDLQRILIGGSKCPDSLIQRMEERLGVEVQTSWGMTELSPVGTIAPPGASTRVPQSSGRPLLGLDLKLTDRNGRALEPQRNRVGHLKVKGASVVDGYFKSGEPVLDREGYFDTGDLASIDDDGNLTICGRSKDLIKSGGEWINPAEIEEIIGRQPGISQVAVIGRPDKKWGERPLLIVEPGQGEAPDASALKEALRGKVADWWIPEQMVVVDAMPIAPTGKIDKQSLRHAYAAED